MVKKLIFGVILLFFTVILINHQVIVAQEEEGQPAAQQKITWDDLASVGFENPKASAPKKETLKETRGETVQQE